jgi:biopolymer transport protein ExbD
MSLARLRFRTRYAEFAHAHGSLNLIPLVDILTAIVFFSLLSAAGLKTALASFDVAQPPTMEAAGVSKSGPASDPDVVLRVDRDRFVLRYWAGERVISRSNTTPEASLAALQRTLTELTRELGRPAHVTVVPSDHIVYDDLIRVLDQVHQAEPHSISFGIRTRR